MVAVKTSFFSTALAASAALGAMIPGGASSPRYRERNWRVATYLGSAATVLAMARGKGTWAMGSGIVAVLTYHQWREEARRRHLREDGLRAYRNARRAKARDLARAR